MSVKYTRMDTPVDADKLSSVRKLVENWLKPVSAEKFYWYSEHSLESDDHFRNWPSYRGEDKYFRDNLFSNRHIKSVFMGHLRCAESFREIACLLKSLGTVYGPFVSGATPLEVFLCTKKALKNWRITRELVPYADNMENADAPNDCWSARDFLKCAYDLKEKLDKNLDGLYYLDPNLPNQTFIEKKKIPVENRFDELEYDLMSLPVHIA